MEGNYYWTEEEKNVVQISSNYGKSLRDTSKNLVRSLHFVQNSFSFLISKNCSVHFFWKFAGTNRRRIVVGLINFSVSHKHNEKSLENLIYYEKKNDK